MYENILFSSFPYTRLEMNKILEEFNFTIVVNETGCILSYLSESTYEMEQMKFD